MDRPDAENGGGEVWSDAWHDFIHLRDNIAGRQEELWYHGGGCGAWLVVDRSNTTHEIFGTRLASERTLTPDGAKGSRP
jgi:sarcosine oxidase subunit delta